MPAAQEEAERAPPHDCLECRMIGSGAMFSISAYFAYLSRGLQTASKNDRRFSAVMSVCFAVAGATRWLL